MLFSATFATSIKTSQNKSELSKISSKSTYLEFVNQVGEITNLNIKTEAGTFTKLLVPGYFPSNEYGMPELQEISRLIEIPYGAKPRIEVVSYDQEIIYLDELGLLSPLMPSQPSLNKSQDPETVKFIYNEEFYNSDAVYTPELISIEKSGNMRGIHMARLVIRPFQYNTADNSLIIKNNLRVRIFFDNADIATTNQMKSKYYSPVFSSIYNRIWNYEAPTNKDIISQYPIKYVIVSDPIFETALQPFVEWKTKKGFNVIEAYTDNAEVGTTTTSIKSYLQNLYTSGSTEDPAPSFLLIVGDVAQIPAFDGDEGSHVSDMYYGEYDGGSDYIPEIYIGRFSATNVAELTPQINKTLQFEMYTMPDPSYLGDAVMVAGVDSGNGETHANGQMNYGTTEYFNTAHGITAHLYNYPESGDNESQIFSDITNGAGYVNYTAHCSQDGWYDPSFTIDDIQNLNNQDKYYVSVGNCCLSNKFEVDCFGEELLRAENEGAVAHLGGSNSTYWDEDFYWSVGLVSSPHNNTTYDESGTGAYDALFHENGEEPYITTAQMNYSGNLSVESSSSTGKKYYWEIYHVMGDPSLMPYLGVPSYMAAEYTDPIPMGSNNLTVTTESGAYVAISLNGVLLDAKIADASGVAELTFSSILDIATADVVATKQNRQPYIGTVEIIPNDNDYDVQLSGIIAPTSLLFIDNATFQPEVKIRNLGQLEMTSASVNYQIDNESIVSDTWTGTLSNLSETTVSFPEITLTEGIYTIRAWACEPNGETDEYPSNDTLTRTFTVYSGDVEIVSIDAPEDMNCNILDLTPAISIKNNDTNPLTSLIVGYTCGSVSHEMTWTGNLAENETASVVFPTATFPAGVQTLSAYINSPNGGTDMDVSDNTLDKEFRVTIGVTIQLDLLTDAYSSETSWDLVEDASNETLYTNGSLSDETHHISDWCLGEGCYTFTIYDSYGDGMEGSTWTGGAPGEVTITNLATEEVYGTIAGDDFTSNSSISFCIGPVGIDNSSNTDLNIFPNPTNDVLFIRGNDIKKIEIIDNLGRVLFSKTNIGNQLDINLSEYANSFVIVKIETANKTTLEKVMITE